jgi:hypothetical protein
LDLEEGHIWKLVDDLRGSGAAVAAASLWAQSLMDQGWGFILAEHGAEWVLSRMPVSVMSAEDVARVLEGMTEEADRCQTIDKAGAIPPLVGLLGSAKGREAEFAAGALRGMAFRAVSWKLIAGAGGIPPLVRLLFSAKGAEAENAAGALWNLVGCAEIQEMSAEAGGIEPLVRLLSSAKGAEAENAAGALWKLAGRAEIQEMIAVAGGIPPLVRLLSSAKGAEAENAAGALWKLAGRAEIQEMIAEAGGIEPLVRLLSSAKGAETELAAGALCCLAERTENQELIALAGGIGPLVRMVSHSRDFGGTSAAGALVRLSCCPGSRFRIAATPGAMSAIFLAILKRPCSDSSSLVDYWHADPALAWAFDESLLRTRTLLATRRCVDSHALALLRRWYPALADEIREYESFDAWKVHVKRCDLRRLLLGWRRGVVDAENAASDQRRASESAAKSVKMADGTAVVAELPPTSSSSTHDGGEVAAPGRVLRKRPR